MSVTSFAQNNIGIGTTIPNASIVLDVGSTNHGLLPPRMTALQRNAIAAPAAGLIIFNSSTGSLEISLPWFVTSRTIFILLNSRS